MLHIFKSKLVVLKQQYYKLLIDLRKIDISINKNKIKEFTTYRQNLNNSVISENYYIFTQPRSGSNWLAEILSQISGKKLIDEPLDLGLNYTNGRLPKPKDYSCIELHNLSFYFDQPIPIEADWDEAREFFLRLFKLEVNSVKLFERSHYRSLNEQSSFIIKFCHGNLLLPWIVRNFNIKPVLLIRHPCAMISSQLNLKDVQKALKGKQYIIPEFKHNNYYTAYKDILNGLKTPEEILCGFWCLGVKNTIYSDFNNIDWLTISYESLYKYYDAEIQRIMNWYGINTDCAKFPNRLNPSMTTMPSSLISIMNNTQLSSWKNRLSTNQINRIMKILELFKIDCYNEDPEPNYDIIYNTANSKN